jgi:hypothetical protein
MKILTYIIAAVLLLNTSCQSLLFSDSEETHEVRLSDFHAVIFSGIYNILLVQDSANNVIIKGKNHIRSIDAIVRNDTLIIDDHKTLSFNTNKNYLELHFKNLNFIRAFDPVSISNKDTIRTNKLTIETLGEIAEVSMNIQCNFLEVATSANTLGYQYYSGKTDYCVLFCRYGSGFMADNLECKSAEIINDSVGEIRINVSEYMKVYLWGNGNILYKGSPLVEIVSQRGSGKVIHL